MLTKPASADFIIAEAQLRLHPISIPLSTLSQDRVARLQTVDDCSYYEHRAGYFDLI